MCGVLDVVCELFFEVFGLLFVCYYCFVVKGDGDVWRLWSFFCVLDRLLFSRVCGCFVVPIVCDVLFPKCLLVVLYFFVSVLLCYNRVFWVLLSCSIMLFYHVSYVFW